jgi:predicted dehydrogenase
MVAGDGGLLEHDSAREVATTVQLDTAALGDGLLPARDADADPYLDELAAFLDVSDPGRGVVDARDGAEAVRLAEAALISISTGQPVELAR